MKKAASEAPRLPEPEEYPHIHKRRTRRGPFSPFDWLDNKMPDDHHGPRVNEEWER